MIMIVLYLVLALAAGLALGWLIGGIWVRRR
jgi:hypothetical protein